MSLVLRNGSIITMTGQPADWVVIDGPFIIGVGQGAAPAGEAFDLEGRTLLPGMGDAHVHPDHGGWSLLNCDLHDFERAEDYLRVVGGYAAAHPRAPWIVGRGWSLGAFPGGLAPASLLDEIVPDRPVFLGSRDGHSAWVNNRALALAGIDRATPDPPDGVIERTPDGSPLGTLQEGAADLVERLLPAAGLEEHIESLLAAQRYLHSVGITFWQDAWVEDDVHEAYRRLDERGGLQAHVVGALWWNRSRELEQVEELIDKSKEGTPRYRPTAVKLMVDGVLENGTAALLDPYEGSEDDRGIQFIEDGLLREAVARLMGAGLQPHFHAIGDRAIRTALDAVEAGRNAHGDVDVRPHIAHIQLIDPADLPRFAALGVVANAQMLWAHNDDYMTELTVPRLGEGRGRLQFPFRALLDAGARFACGSDWSVSTADPFAQMEVAVRRRLGDDMAPFVPEQAITISEALGGFTLGTAFVNHDEAMAGRISPGRRADLVVVDRHPLEAESPGQVQVEATFVEGRPVYERA